jgi:hypothetical protein
MGERDPAHYVFWYGALGVFLHSRILPEAIGIQATASQVCNPHGIA